MMKHIKNPALTPEALYNKSKVYIRRGLKAYTNDDIDEYLLWASLALELLGKAILAQVVHPAMIVDPQHSDSLFAACGHQMSSDIKTITAKTLFERLSRINKRFDEKHQKFCGQTAMNRNAELHSGESPFSATALDVWERNFWSAIEEILKTKHENLQSWLGVEDARTPNEIIKKASKILQEGVVRRIEEHKKKFKLKAKDHVEARHIVISKTHFDEYKFHKCVACGLEGALGGVFWEENTFDPKSDVEDLYDPEVEYVQNTYTVQEFHCANCDLHLDGLREIQAASLPTEFSAVVEKEREYEPDYGND